MLKSYSTPKTSQKSYYSPFTNKTNKNTDTNQFQLHQIGNNTEKLPKSQSSHHSNNLMIDRKKNYQSNLNNQKERSQVSYYLINS